MRENLVQPLLTHVLQRCFLVFRLIWRQCLVFVEDSGTLAASRWWYRFPETSEHNLSLSSSCLKERNLQLRHTEVCWTVDTVTPAGQTFALNCSHCCHPSFFCSIKVISCKLNTSLLSYWLNEAQLKKVSFCRLTRHFLFLSPQKCSEYELNFTQKASNTHVWSWYYKSFRILSFVSHWRGIRCNLSESNRPHPV